MAIYHLSMKPLSRTQGRSAVAAAAYRAGEKLTNARDGLVHDFTRKSGIRHTAIVLPEDCEAPWVCDRSALWNAAEQAEKRKDARVAREFELALPHELSTEQRAALVHRFARELANRYGTAVDLAIHDPHDESDNRNHHAHALMTTRKVTAEGLGDKTPLERENRWLKASGLPTTDMQLNGVRLFWEQITNEALVRAGLDLRIDHRSHLERGLEIGPTEHMGVQATQMERRGLVVTRGRLDPDVARHNARLIREKPEQVLTILTDEKSVFDKHDIARTLHRYLNDDAETYQAALAAIMASPALVELQPETPQARARYSTREMVAVEAELMRSGEGMHSTRSHGVAAAHVRVAIARQDEAIRRASGDRTAGLAGEQRDAIAHITAAEQIALVVGFAGAGKSTMLAAAREAWEAQGYRVHGAALSGKAAEGLEDSSGIASRTLASWERGWQNGRGTLGPQDVFVIDEAGMVGSRQLARFVGEAQARGAKIVLVGDHEQLQAIGAGAPFRALSEAIGHAELSGIRRQRQDWQRAASVAFATHRTDVALQAYADHGDVQFVTDDTAVRSALVDDYLADLEARPHGTRVAMAHRRVDVQALNDAIRQQLQQRGSLPQGTEAGERTFMTRDGERAFAAADRLVFLENNRDLGVKNGLLATVVRVDERGILALPDGRTEPVFVSLADYPAVDHGYATTIHKNQGATVERAFVLASRTMDRHLTYVAMTRHRDRVGLYASRRTFGGLADLTAQLGRSGVKESTTDNRYAFAARRGIADGQGAAEGAPPAIAAERPLTGLAAALEAYARVYQAVVRQVRRDPSARQAGLRQLRAAGEALEQLRPGLMALLRPALERDAGLRRAMLGQEGTARVEAMVAAIERESRIQANPQALARRLVNRRNGPQGPGR